MGQLVLRSLEIRVMGFTHSFPLKKIRIYIMANCLLKRESQIGLNQYRLNKNRFRFCPNKKTQ
jgi:hypothetical protein